MAGPHVTLMCCGGTLPCPVGKTFDPPQGAQTPGMTATGMLSVTLL